MLDRHQQAHLGCDFQVQLYPLIFSALGNPYAPTPEFGHSELGELQGAPEESDPEGSLCLVTTPKSGKSKVNAPAGKLKPTRMSARESDSKVITTPLQQSFPE